MASSSSSSSRSSMSSDPSSLDTGVADLVGGQVISTAHRAALEQLKGLCNGKCVYWNGGSADGKRVLPSNDDVTLLRYLRARDYSPQAAFKQYSTTVAWRRKLGLNDMYKNAEISHFEAMRRLMPQWTGRRSRNGVPVFVYSVSKTRPEDLLATTRKDPGLSSVFLPAEYSTRFVQPLCARMHVNRAMPCSIFIVDLTGVTVRHFWNLRAHLQRVSTMATLHYPESVEKIFILGAPSFFPTVWGYINKWFEPNLTSKISVLPTSAVKTVLSQHIHVEDLPKLYGGNMDWEYGMYPNLDREASAVLGPLGDDFVDGPLLYVDAEDGDEIVAAGTEGEKVRDAVLAKLPAFHPGLWSSRDCEENPR